MYSSHYQAAVLKLLEESPVTTPSVIDDVRASVRAGETELAFSTLCEWIYEDELSITRGYYGKLVELADEMNAKDLVGKIATLVIEE